MSKVKDEELTTYEETGLPEEAEILMKEDELIAGLLDAADYKNNEEKLIRISRDGVKKFEFKIRPLSEAEVAQIRKRATTYMPNPGGKKLPKIEKEFKFEEFRSIKIYEATTDEYKAKLWDNPRLISQLKAKGHDILTATDVIECVLMAGEKAAINDKIDELSGFGSEEIDLVDYAKN